MGMIGAFIRINESELILFLENSTLLEDKIDSKGEDDNTTIGIDKSWDALSYLLIGFTLNEIQKAKPPLTWTIFGDNVIDEYQDLGYGPASYLTPQQVSEVYSALRELKPSFLKEKYNPEKMIELDIYPQIWNNDKSVLDYLINCFEELKAFYKTASESKQAIIMYLS